MQTMKLNKILLLNYFTLSASQFSELEDNERKQTREREREREMMEMEMEMEMEM